jgi:hypothetical protein
METKKAPPPGAEFALNVILHVFIMFAVLILMYNYVVIPSETKSITKQMSKTFASAVNLAWMEAVPPKAAPYLQPGLAATVPLLTRLSASYANTDQAQIQSNKKTMQVAYFILALLGTCFLVTVVVLYQAGVYYKDMERMLAQVGFENLVVLAVVGAAEFTFFMKVGSKYIPVMPSAVTTAIFGELTEK